MGAWGWVEGCTSMVCAWVQEGVHLCYVTTG